MRLRPAEPWRAGASCLCSGWVLEECREHVGQLWDRFPRNHFVPMGLMVGRHS